MGGRHRAHPHIQYDRTSRRSRTATRRLDEGEHRRRRESTIAHGHQFIGSQTRGTRLHGQRRGTQRHAHLRDPHHGRAQHPIDTGDEHHRRATARRQRMDHRRRSDEQTRRRRRPELAQALETRRPQRKRQHPSQITGTGIRQTRQTAGHRRPDISAGDGHADAGRRHHPARIVRHDRIHGIQRQPRVRQREHRHGGLEIRQGACDLPVGFGRSFRQNQNLRMARRRQLDHEGAYRGETPRVWHRHRHP